MSETKTDSIKKGNGFGFGFVGRSTENGCENIVHRSGYKTYAHMRSAVRAYLKMKGIKLDSYYEFRLDDTGFHKLTEKGGSKNG